MTLTFKEAFCQRFDCRPENFERELLKRCLYSHAKVCWSFFDLAGGKPIRIAHQFVELIGQIRTREELRDVIDEYREDIRPHGGFLVQTLKFRVSIEKLVALYDSVCPPVLKQAEAQQELPGDFRTGL